MKDKLEDAFSRQEEFMKILKDYDKLPEYPVDLTSKFGQRLAKEVVFNLSDELHEATATLKNKMHRISDDRSIDFDHYREELGDAFAFFMELCLISGISAEQLYDEYCRKNAIVRKRFESGY
jgi:hypothetical protein